MINDKYHGITIGWYTNGQLEYEEFYNEDELITAKCWNSDGTITDCK